jgi:hypothetical protein
MKFPGSIKVRIICPVNGVSICTGVMSKATPEKTIVHLNALAVIRKIDARYELASEEEYTAYRNALQKQIVDLKKAIATA